MTLWFLLSTAFLGANEENVAWLKGAVERQLDGCRVMSDSGVVLHTPDGIGHYKALWTRDYYYMVKYAGEFLDNSEIKASIGYLLNGQREDGCIPDRVNAEGLAIYSPGGVNNPLADHALDNGPFMALLACEYVRKTDDLAYFCQIEPALRKGLDHVRRAENGLVYNPPENPQCVYGFTDIVVKTGHLLFSSLLYYQACLEMEELSKVSGCGDPPIYRRRADLIRESINLLWDKKTGMFLAADKDCRQVDIWGSAYAVETGLTSASQADRIAAYLIGQKDAIFEHGQVRHLPDEETWERLFIDSHPEGSYQNGAHWATPLPWIVPVVARKDAALARKLVADAIKDFQENGIAECIHQGTRKVPDFVVSITNLYAAHERIY